jgi:hypothetical protein
MGGVRVSRVLCIGAALIMNLDVADGVSAFAPTEYDDVESQAIKVEDWQQDPV